MSAATRTSPGDDGGPGGPRPRRTGDALLTSALFRRVFSTFLLTLLLAAAGAGWLAFRMGGAHGPAWFEPIFARLEAEQGPLVDALEDPELLERERARLERELGLEIRVLQDRRAIARRARELPVGIARRLRRGDPVALPAQGGAPTRLLVPLVEAEGGRPVALLELSPPSRRGLRSMLALLAVVGTVATGAWMVSSFLTARLRRLEHATARLAAGELGTRAPVRDAAVPDELDELALAFNHMADRVEALVDSQRTLLTNVSHELRTPVARIKVLLEILEERLDGPDHPDRATTMQRVRRGLTELGEDVEEIELLIDDLLTSGRMALQEDAALELASVVLAPVVERLGARVGAVVDCPAAVQAHIDLRLFERLLSNLLANARRAADTGEVRISLRQDDAGIELAVEDTGPGVAVADRERIFAPFTRLDAARDRDRGGVGLGLHLARQIARAHRGTLTVEDRVDGGRGARFVLRLPAPPAR